MTVTALTILCYLQDIGLKGYRGHVGTDGSDTEERILRHCKWKETMGENVMFCESREGDTFVLGLFIDDGVPDRHVRFDH